MIRILYITDTLMAGGVERQLTELVTRLDRTRYEPHIICLYAERAGRSLYFLERLKAASIAVYVLDLGWSSRDKIRAIGAILRLIWHIRPQIVQPMNYHSNLLSRMARLLMPPRTVLIGHFLTASTPKQLRYEQLTGRFCRLIICNSQHLAQQLIEVAHLPAKFVRWLPNGVDIDYFSHTPPVEHITAIRGKAKHVFLTIGRISKEKSQHLLVEAIGLLKVRGKLPAAMKLIIVGEVEQSALNYKQMIDEIIKHYELENIIYLYPQTPYPEHYYHATDITVLVSQGEGLPNVAMESLATGRPLIISDSANGSGIVQHNVHGWIVPSNSVDELAAILLQATNQSAEERSRMQKAAQERARDFDVYKMVRDYQAIYDEFSIRP